MVRGALVGTGIVALCFLPPLLHFILGPLAPLIGGFVGGSQAAKRTANPLAPLGVGLLLGLFLSIIAAVVAIPIIVSILSVIDQPPASLALFVLMLLTVLAWGALLGTGGAYLGAITRGRKEQTATEGDGRTILGEE